MIRRQTREATLRHELALALERAVKHEPDPAKRDFRVVAELLGRAGATSADVVAFLDRLATREPEQACSLTADWVAKATAVAA